MTEESGSEFTLAGATVRFRFAGHTDRGAVRSINEDSFFAVPPVFVVADGMGGHAHGDKASRAAVSAFSDRFEAGVPTDPTTILSTISAANDAVFALPGEALSGTTLTGIALVRVGPAENHHWMAFNVGDSRTYSWDGRTLTQLTVDHSAVQELIDAGEITKGEAEQRPDRNVVTRALGASREVDPDVWLLPARSRQTFLLCSDGLTKELGDDEIARIMVFHESEHLRHPDTTPMSLAERLVGAAIAAGGSDNVTAVIVESEFSGILGGQADGDTIERGGLAGLLEDTRPRG